jgi:tRNA-modifying protein YgfZ
MSDVTQQLRAAREGALVDPRPDLGTLVVTGKDRQTWLNGLCTCDLAKLRPGGGAFGLSVGKNGKIQSELFVVIGADAIHVGVPRDRAAALRDGLDRYLIMEDAEIHDRSDEHRWILLHGPGAVDLLSAAVVAGAGGAALDRTGLGGAAIVVPVEAEADMVATLLDRAGPTGARATPEGWHQLRLEQGLGEMGVDYTEDSYPQEAALERLAVSFDKGCYLGQETVYMLEVRGHVKKKLVQLSVDGDGVVPLGAEITGPDGKVVGHVTTSGKRLGTGGRAGSPHGHGESLALGMVKYKLIAPGTEVAIAGRTARVL